MPSIISGFSVSNFRIFDAPTKMAFAPLTILTGKNNSGKSTVIKALQLLSENNKANKLTKIDFNLPGEKHGLNDFELVKNKNNPREEIDFEIDINSKELVSIYDYFDELGEQEAIIHKEDRNFVLNFKYLLEKTVTGNYMDDFGDIKESTKTYRNIIDKVSIYEIYDDGDEKKIEKIYSKENIAYFNLEWVNKYRDIHNYIKQERGFIPSILETVDITFPYLRFEYDLNLIKRDFFYEKLKDFNQDFVTEFLNILNILFLNSFSQNGVSLFNNPRAKNLSLEFLVLYLSHQTVFKVGDLFEDNPILLSLYEKVLKVIGDIQITNENKSSDIVVDNLEAIMEELYENANKIINIFYNQINFDYLEAVKANAQRIYLRQWQGSTLNELLEEFRNANLAPDGEELKFINKWFGKEGFEIGDSLEIKTLHYGTELKLTRNGHPTDFADLGYGSIQLLSVLLKIVLSKSNVLMLEEPEIHLHPNMQSKLADMFADAYKTFGKQFLIETHSEYLIRKLQYLTAKKQISTEDTVILYFTAPQDLQPGEEQVREIRIKENGSLTKDFGSGFFDEADNLAVELFLLSDASKN